MLNTKLDTQDAQGRNPARPYACQTCISRVMNTLNPTDRNTPRTRQQHAPTRTNTHQLERVIWAPRHRRAALARIGTRRTRREGRGHAWESTAREASRKRHQAAIGYA